MSDPSTRMLRLLSLLQAHRDWPGPELAGRLEVSERTLRRDVDRLRTLGYEVHATRGAAGGYRLDAGADLPPLLLDDEEAVAIAVGLRAAAVSGVSGMGETSVRALAKLEQVLPARLRRRLRTLGAATESLTRWPSEATVDGELLAGLAAAVRDEETRRFRYRRREDDEAPPQRRHVEPHRLVQADGRWYLVAFDLERGDWRTFRVDRIAGTPAAAGRFRRRELPAPDAAAYVRASLGSVPRRLEAEVRLHAPVDRLAWAARWFREPMRPGADGTTLLRTRSDSAGWLAAQLLALGEDFELLDAPADVVEALEAAHGRIGRALGGAGGAVSADA